MNFKTFPEQNAELGKPIDWKDDQCGTLPVWKGIVAIDNNGGVAHANTSCWQVTPEDLERIKETGEIWLRVIGVTQPPVAVFTERPDFVEPESLESLIKLVGTEYTKSFPVGFVHSKFESPEHVDMWFVAINKQFGIHMQMDVVEETYTFFWKQPDPEPVQETIEPSPNPETDN